MSDWFCDGRDVFLNILRLGTESGLVVNLSLELFLLFVFFNDIISSWSLIVECVLGKCSVATVLLEDVLTSVIDNVALSFVDCTVVEVCLIEDRFSKSFGISDEGMPPRINELVGDGCCFEFT